MFTHFSYIVSVRCLGLGMFFFSILRTVFPSMTSFRGSAPFVFLSERQLMTADILPVLITLSICLPFSFTSHFFCFGCLIWRAFASRKSSSSRPCCNNKYIILSSFCKTSRLESIMVSDIVMVTLVSH